MTKKIVYFLMLAFSLSLFSACSDDDDDDKDYAKEIAGTYTGDLTISVPETEPVVTNNINISVTRNSTDKVQVELKDFTYESMDLDITVENIPVTKSNNTYSLAETSKELELAGGAIKANVKVSGTVDSSKKLNLKIDVTATTPQLFIPVTFSGEIKK